MYLTIVHKPRERLWELFGKYYRRINISFRIKSENNYINRAAAPVWVDAIVEWLWTWRTTEKCAISCIQKQVVRQLLLMLFCSAHIGQELLYRRSWMGTVLLRRPAKKFLLRRCVVNKRLTIGWEAGMSSAFKVVINLYMNMLIKWAVNETKAVVQTKGSRFHLRIARSWYFF